MGLLTDWIPDDPTTQNGLLALSAGLMAGRPAQGVMALAQATSPENRAKLELTKAQLEDIRQQIGLRSLQLQQQTEQFNMLSPMLRAYASGFQGGGAPGAPGASAPSQPAIPPSPGGALGSGTYGIPSGGQAPQSSPLLAGGGGGGGSMFGVPYNVGGPVLAFGGPQKFAETISSYNAPTDFVKLMQASGIDPNTPLGRQLIQSQLAKQNYQAPVNARPGSILRDPYDPSKIVAFNPHVPEGSRPEFDQGGNVSAFQPIGNAEAALALPQRAQTYGKAQATPSVVYRNGVPAFSTAAQDIGRANGPLPPAQPGVSLMPGFNANDPNLEAQIAKLPPQEQANVREALRMQAAMPPGERGTVTPQQAPGVVPGANASQEELSKKWTELNAMNGQAQTTKSYLDSIKQLAQKAATGPFTDKLQFANALLAQVGSERAMDATTANNLLDKYGNQIVSRLGGSGGLSTDAARAILQSAYPNAHMTTDAINDAADNLIGANSMIQSKARLLQEHANARDPAAYNQREIAFDQAADPRIWQLANMDAASAQRYLSRMPPNVQADLKRRALALKQMGAL